MAIVIDSISIKGLRLAHFLQLKEYAEAREMEGWYIGRKDYYEKRHQEISEWLEEVIDLLKSEGVIVPKRRKDNAEVKKEEKEA